MACGRGLKQGVWLNVDYIKPRTTHPYLALSIFNCQILATSAIREKVIGTAPIGDNLRFHD
jgi:hypothetical protein